MKIQITDSEAIRVAGGWHDSMHDPLYAISSSHGRNIPEEIVEKAISNLSADLRKVKKLSKNDPFFKAYGKGTHQYQFGQSLYTAAEIDELRYLRDAFTLALAQARRQAAPNDDPVVRKMIVDAMARAFFVEAWARNEEEKPKFRERGYGGHGHQVDIMDVAPRTNAAANAAAKELAKDIERANGRSLTSLYTTAVAQEGHRKEPNPTDFGHYLAMQAMGHGVSWWDDHPKFPMTVPYHDFYM
jgi:hypothetical protein